MALSIAKRISIVATAVALATLIHGNAFAQSANPGATPPQTRTQPSNPSNRPSSGQDDLNLSDEQKKAIESILVKRQQDIEAVLTQEQRNRVAQAQRSGEQISPQTLNLQPEQIARIRDIIASSNNQIKQVLTPEQLQQLQNQQPQPTNQRPQQPTRNR